MVIKLKGGDNLIKKPKITKENIINEAYNIVKNEGMENLNVRNLASHLKSSVQPIYYQFGNIENLKKEVLNKVIETYGNYMNIDSNEKNSYKQIGLNYIKFAKQEPKLFQLIFMTKTDLSIDKFMESDKNFDKIKQYVSLSTGLKDKKVKTYHTKMWLFTHGIACLVATNTCIFTDKEISDRAERDKNTNENTVDISLLTKSINSSSENMLEYHEL